jgi:shikimate kinase
MLTDLRKGIWSELVTKQPIDIYRRNLQKTYVEALTRMISGDGGGNLVISLGGGSITSSLSSRTSDAVSIAKAQLRTLASEVRSSLPLYKDANSRAHLQDVLERMDQALKPK